MCNFAHCFSEGASVFDPSSPEVVVDSSKTTPMNHWAIESLGPSLNTEYQAERH